MDKIRFLGIQKKCIYFDWSTVVIQHAGKYELKLYVLPCHNKFIEMVIKKRLKLNIYEQIIKVERTTKTFITIKGKCSIPPYFRLRSMFKSQEEYNKKYRSRVQYLVIDKA